jgi:heterodisulfide reductase subunit A2
MIMSDKKVLVIGSGPAGLEAARCIADLGVKVVLVEQRDRLGGSPIQERYAKLTHHFHDSEEIMNKMIASVQGHPNVAIRTNTTVVSSEGTAGHFSVTLDKGGAVQVVDVGAVIVASGFQHFDPGRETQYYNYYTLPDVITIADLEGILKSKEVVRPSTRQAPHSVAFIQCVGSRDRQIGNEYCSKVCCGVACKQAIEIREQLPDSQVLVFYIDMRLYGYWEPDLYWHAQEAKRVSFIKGIVSEILPKGDRLLIRGEDTTLGRPVEMTVDLVVLSVGMEPSEGTKALANIFGIEKNTYGFINAGGASGMDPVATSRPGVFVVGTAAGPADLDDCFSTAGLAAVRAVTILHTA